MHRKVLPLSLAGEIALILTLVCGCSTEDPSRYVVFDEARERSIEYHLLVPENTGPHPLILFSHGSGGDFRGYGWIINSLLEEGYAVAALNHPGNSAGDNSPEGIARVWDRPKDLTLILDDVLSNPELSKQIDNERIGAVGHSSGGYTVIALAGAIFNPEGMNHYCGGGDRGADCDLVDENTTVDYSGSSASYQDERVVSVVALAPAVGPAIETRSLQSIDIPVLIVAPQDDEILPYAKHAMHYVNAIPGAELEVLTVGGHFAFLQCNWMTQIVDLFIREFDLCGEPDNSDRETLQAEMAPRIVNFFDGSMATAVERS